MRRTLNPSSTHTHTPRLFSHLSFLLFTHLSFSSLLFSYFPLRPFTSSPLPAPFLLSSSPPLAIPLLLSTFFPHSFSPEIVLSCSFSLVLSASLPFPPLLFFPFHSPHLAEAPHPECCNLFLCSLVNSYRDGGAELGVKCRRVRVSVLISVCLADVQQEAGRDITLYTRSRCVPL